ncbi:Caspase-3 [Eumeta japonica]|uniref:Caspase-3 n=1 Tax=Eumeta variegata TaxID=151549 RepID=A0A4C2A475_EUMVA|nr:Caspase-3 [Eumeta japonica]
MSKSLRNSFEALGFEVTVHQDLFHDEILKALREVSQLDPATTSCVAVALMSHGDSGVIHAADRPYPVRDLFAYFLSEQCNLTNVPKLFFIQACRGDMVDSGRVALDGEEGVHLPTHANLLIVYATVEDHVSWRESTGSWLIQSLCKVLDMYGDKYDLLWLMTLVHREVAYNYASYTRDKTKHNKKQMPETKFSLTKLVFFNKF